MPSLVPTYYQSCHHGIVSPEASIRTVLYMAPTRNGLGRTEHAILSNRLAASAQAQTGPRNINVPLGYPPVGSILASCDLLGRLDLEVELGLFCLTLIQFYRLRNLFVSTTKLRRR
ncbi:hypothetical protein CDD82_1830 [Ophiocordyceps australis]|uniref:Uncharacterized protein n=1 Tax=Ophiocordyceps australis TaxID=1399860 RepID=A0A2C5Y2X4_9HYPO|nr:hypothetical protein CDD82_1830 [Ophiocordyceps australis]